MALAFDTHKAIKGLKEAGFEEAQAEAVVATVGEAMSGNVATKSDIAGLEVAIVELKAELKNDIGGLRAELTGDINRLEGNIGGLRAELTGDINRLEGNIGGLRAELTGDINRLERNIGELKGEMYRHMWIMGGTIIAATVGLVKLLP